MPKDHAEAATEAADLTENEGSLLGLVLRNQPITAYQVLKFYEGSPTSRINQSKGSIYPMIRRLKERGYLLSEPVQGDGRHSELLSASAAGRKAVERWVKDLRLDHTLVTDPMRSRILSMDLLDREDQLRWIVDAKRLTSAKLEELDRYRASVEVPFHDVVHLSAHSTLEAKLRWLDRLLEEIVTRPGRPVES